ncbi:ATP-dependent dethiobiotin synthetase BioD, partial [Pseudonocardia nigra]|uniref:ATP-dependent dethiobiotin synthetase BioD n=1 Tax=Pseudonocardia nigra TaxID=1921578 RepID=UPI001C5EA948
AAARRADAPPVTPAAAAEAARELAADHDLVLVEGAGGLLVRFTDHGGTLADVAALLDAPVVVATAAGLGTLNASELTVEALRARGLVCTGLVIGAWPGEPDLAETCNLADLPATSGVPLLGAVPESSGTLHPEVFAAVAHHSLAPVLGGGWHTPVP